MSEVRRQSVVVFGTGPFADLARYCLENDGPYRVVAHAVDAAYLPHKDLRRHAGLPLVAFEELLDTCPPDDCALLLPIGYRSINGLRKERYAQAKLWGYRFVTYISSRASVWPDLVIGENCMIFEGTVIQPFARIGDNVIVRSSVHLSHHCSVESHCFVAAGVVTGGGVSMGESCFVGLGAVIRDNIHLASETFIGAGAVVVSRTERGAVYVGNPARRLNKTSFDVTKV